MSVADSKRDYFLDIIRFFMVILVVWHHAGQAYGPTGGEWPVKEGPQVLLLGTFFSINAAYFMGLLFLISGYVLELTYNRYGFKKYVLKKINHILIPMFFVMFVIFLPVQYIFGDYNNFGSYMKFIFTAQGIRSITGHLWFLQHLFIYSICYALFRVLTNKNCSSCSENTIDPKIFHASILLFVGVLGAVSYIVRIEYPIDRWIVAANIISMEPAHFPQYFAFFIAGLFLRRFNILNRINYRHGLFFLSIALFIIVVFISLELGVVNLHIARFIPCIVSFGTLLNAYIESLFAVCISIGLLFTGKKFFNFQNSFTKFHSDNSYGLYLIHVFPQVGLQMAMQGSSIPVWIKFLASGIVAVYIGYLTTLLVRLIPGAKKYI